MSNPQSVRIVHGAGTRVSRRQAVGVLGAATVLALAGAGLVTPTAWAQTPAAAGPQPAVIFDMGGKFDKSFNEAAFRGAEAWKKETGRAYLEFEIANPAQREQALRRMACSRCAGLAISNSR